MNTAPIANDDTVLTDELSVTVDVLANDYDPDDDVLTITNAVVLSGLGDVEFTDTDITFTPSGSTQAMISYTITDSFGHYANALLTVNVSPTGGGNTPPIANHDFVVTTVNEPVTVDVLANDSDADGDTLFLNYIEIDNKKVGTVNVNEDNTVTFSPTLDFIGDVVITYRIADTAAASATASLIVAVSGVIDGDEFSNTLTGSSADDVLSGMEGNDKLFGNHGDDLLDGGDDNDSLVGGNGDDWLEGGDGNDTLAGGLGDDLLMGGDGSDQYLFGLGDGQDIIDNLGDDDTVDQLVLRIGIDSSMIELQGDSDNTDDLIIAIKGTTDRVSIQDYFVDESYQLDEIKFADGTVWRKAQLNLMPIMIRGEEESEDVLFGTERHEMIEGLSGDDWLEGGDGNDTLVGGLGDDLLVGGDGSNQYLFGLGDGQDTIDNLGDDDTVDQLVFRVGIDSSMIELQGDSDNADDLIIAIKGTTDRVSIQDYFVGESYQLDEIKFADGTVWRKAQLNLMPIMIRGEEESEDVLFGTERHEMIEGLSGDDWLEGGDGNDTLVGGLGDDLLVGGEGSDSYLFNRSAEATGQDIIDDIDGLNTMIITGTTLAQIGVSQTANDLILTLQNSSDNITIKNFFDTSKVVNYQLSLDAGVVDKAGILQLLPKASVIVGTEGSDILLGSTENDTYIVNTPRDLIKEPTDNNSVDTVQASVSYVLFSNLENLSLTGSANLSGTGNSADNVLQGNSGNNRLLAGDGNDTIYGGVGGDTLNGGSGADVMYGGTGNDTFTVEHSGDVVIELLDEGFDTVNSFISYTLTANVERLILEGMESLNGFGNELDNTLNGNNFNNYLFGGAGNDTLQGKGGADTLDGGLGDDLYYIDNTGDIVVELANEGTDKVSSSVSYTLTTHLEQLFLTGIAALSGTGNELDNIIYGNEGNNQLLGGVGNDSLNGGAGNDTLDGGVANDTLVGGAGDDSYLFGINAGRDVINNNDALGNDTLLFDAGINADQVWLRQLGNDLEVSIIGTANSIKVQNWYSGTANQLDSLQLADGKTLLATEVETLVEAMAAFAVPSLGQTSLTTAQHTALDSVIAASW